MPWLPLYLYGRDTDDVLTLLNNDPEIAFLVANGPGRWKAVAALLSLPTERYSIWHVPSGPLPMLGDYPGGLIPFPVPPPTTWITDPRKSWTEEQAGADSSQPYFGPSPLGVIRFTLRGEAAGRQGNIRISTSEWVGRHYSVLGSIPAPETERWWKRLRRTFEKLGSNVPRGGPRSFGKPEIYGLPSAMEAHENGATMEINPW